jgi:hypothetical protein
MAEDSHDPRSINENDDYVSKLYPTAPDFLIKRIAHQQRTRRERLQKAQAAHGTYSSGVPMPPVQTFPAKFRCQLCSKVIDLSQLYQWTEHVYEDLESFTCTYEHCDDSKHFKRKNEWFRHEKTHQLDELWVCAELSATTTESAGWRRKASEICLEGHVSEDKFQVHLKGAHGIRDDQAEAMAQEYRYINKKRPGDGLWICRELSTTNRKTDDKCLKGHVRKDNLHQHLTRAHKIDNVRAKSMVQECQYVKAHPENEPCPFCGATNFKRLKDRTSHLAGHLKHIVYQDIAHQCQQHH